MFQRVISSLVLISSLILTGCVTGSGNPGGSGVGEPGGFETVAAYRLRPLDPIYIRFSGILEQTEMEQVIDEKGQITLLHIEAPVVAAGLTTSELEDQIERLYIDGEIYRNVAVNVAMTAKFFYVEGEVLQPGQFQLASGTTLRQAIAAARGYTKFANPKRVLLTRQGKTSEYNMKDIEKNPSKDIKVEAGDVIKIPLSRI